MGWERKRGKIVEFNRLLRSSADTSFSVKIGDLSILPSVRYVLTLDAEPDEQSMIKHVAFSVEGIQITAVGVISLHD